MSTVVVTPTHIASDHNFVDFHHPGSLETKLDHKKIFISPDKKFIIGMCGSFHQSQVDDPKMYEAVSHILTKAIANTQLMGEKFNIIKKDDYVNHFLSVVDIEGKIIVIGKDHRYVLYDSKIEKNLVAVPLAPYFGIGTGGLIAAGILIGGRSIRLIWNDLNRLDPLSSKEHTIIPLSILKKGF